MYLDVEIHLQKMTQMIVEQGKILWLISIIDRKFSLILEKAFDITHITEYIIQILWNRITHAIALDKIQNPQMFIN